MSHKIITLDSLFPTGEATVQLVATLGRDGRTLRENTSLTRSKTASQSPALDYIRSVEPEPGKTIVLVIGLGDHETYGPNRNGDGFPSEPVKGAITPDQVLTKHFKSYENAHVFEHHINNDPAKAIGKVRKAFWNPYMRRVEVLEDFDHEKAPHLLEQIGDGEFPSKSMGCVPAGTRITLGDKTTKCVEKIAVGDEVLTHKGRVRTVTETHVRSYAGDLYTVQTAESLVRITSKHPFWVAGPGGHEYWVDACCLDPHQHLLVCPDKPASARCARIESITVEHVEIDVYNFEVDEDESYVAAGYAVHNCRIPYDVCTVCLNKAPTRKEYCTHLLFEMSVIRPDGTQVCALNPAPNFFDSSWVKRPADRTGFMLKKVAYEIRTGGYELAEQVDALRDKAAALGKAADIEKVVTGEPVASASGGDDGTLRLVRNLVEHGGETAPPARIDVTITTNYPPGEAVGTADALGLPMGLKDLIRYFMSRLGVTPDEAALDCGCKHASAVYELFAEYPDFYDEVVKAAGLLELSTNEKLAAQIADARISDTPMGRPLIRGPWSTETPNTDVLTFTDGQGRTMRSNVGLARSATRALEPEARARKAAVGAGYMGLGTLLGLGGSAAMLLGKRAPTRFLGGAATAAGLGLGAKGVHEVARPLRMGDLHGTQLMSNEGYIMPGLTEMKAASWHPEMAYVQLRLQDGKEACTPLPPQRKLAFMHAARAAEASDRTLNLEKIASILEKSIASLEI